MKQVGKPVTGRGFIGREKEITLLMQYLKMGQSVVLIAPRRFGKTSLVLEVLNRLKKEDQCYTAFIDVFANPGLNLLAQEIVGEVLANHGLKKQFNKLRKSARELLSNINLKAKVDEFEFLLDFAGADKDEWSMFQQSIDFVDQFSIKNRKNMVCSFDEFGEIKKFDQDNRIIKLIRSKIQQQKNSTYLFSGSYESVMQSIFVTRKSPFYRMTRIIRLGYLELDVLRKYYRRQVKSHKIPASSDQLDDYLDISKGHPYYAQVNFTAIVPLLCIVQADS